MNNTKNKMVEIVQEKEQKIENVNLKNDEIDNFILENRIEIPSELKPIELKISDLMKKYENEDFNAFCLEFQRAAKHLQDLNKKMRELNVIQEFLKMTNEQKHLNQFLENNRDKIKNEASHKNVIVLFYGENNKFEIQTNYEEKTICYSFFANIETASDFCDEEFEEENLKNLLVSPIFIAI